MYHINHAQVWYELCVSFSYSWIDVLDLNQPFEMELIWGLQPWTLICARLNVQDWSLSNATWPFRMYLSQNNPSKCKVPKLEMKISLKVLNIIYPQQGTTKHMELSLQEVEFRLLFLNSSHCIQNMYHIIHAQVDYEFCISFLYSWIDVLDSN